MKKRLFALFVCVLCVAVLFGCVGCSHEKERDVYEISVQTNGKTLSATQKITYRNKSGNALKELRFNLFGNAYREGAKHSPVPQSLSSAYYAGASYGGTEISSVSPCRSWEIGGADQTVLIVVLEEELFPEETVTLQIDFSLTLADVNHRTGRTRHSVNLGNFFPIVCVYEEGKGFYECEYASNGDPFYSECADYIVKLTVPKEYTAQSSGETVAATAENGDRQYTFRAENVRDFAIVCGTEYKTLHATQNGVQLSYSYYADENPQKTLTILQESIAYFCKTFGAFPYKTYAAVQTGFCYGGMEYPGLCMISDALSEREKLYTAVHETAHQWWYAAVGNNQVENAWMDEGLAEYSSLLFFGEYPKYEIFPKERLKQSEHAFHTLCDVQKQVFGKADTTMNRKLGEYGNYEYTVIAYDKGLLLADALRSGLGDRAFFSGLRRYYREYGGRIASPDDFAASFHRAGAKEIVQSFTEGTAVL